MLSILFYGDFCVIQVCLTASGRKSGHLMHSLTLVINFVKNKIKIPFFFTKKSNFSWWIVVRNSINLISSVFCTLFQIAKDQSHIQSTIQWGNMMIFLWTYISAWKWPSDAVIWWPNAGPHYIFQKGIDMTIWWFLNAL